MRRVVFAFVFYVSWVALPVRAFTPEEVQWDLLSNGLMEIVIPSPHGKVYTELHRVMRSGFTNLTIEQLEVLAKSDNLMVFVVEYEKDRYAYFVEVEPSRVCRGPYEHGGCDVDGRPAGW